MDRLIGLVVLRWRTDLRAVTRARERLVGLALMVPGLVLFSVVASLAIFFGVATVERAYPEALLPLLSVLATGVGISWALSPLMAGVAFTESHDMSRLLHFPIPLPTLVASSLAANLAQPMVLAEVPVLIALAAALAGGLERFAFALVGVGLSFAVVLAVAQAAGLVLHGLSRNRRLYDWALFVGLVLGVGISLAPLVLLVSDPGAIAGLLRGLVRTDVFVLSPFAWGVRAAACAGRGDAAGFLVGSLASVVATAVAMAASALLIHLIYRGELSLGSSATSSTTARARMPLRGAVGTLVEKDLRAAWREPALKATLFVGLIGPLLFLMLISQTGPGVRSGDSVLLLASFVGISALGSNCFGFERRGIGLLLGFPVARFQILIAKNLAALAFRLPGLLVLLVAGFLLAPLSYLPAAATIALATQLLAAGADNFLSILFPAAIPEPGKNPYGGPAAGGRGLGAVVLIALSIPLVLMLSVPFAFLAWLPILLGRPALWLASLPLALAGATSVYAMLAAGAARLLSRREPELLERILGEA